MTTHVYDLSTGPQDPGPGLADAMYDAVTRAILTDVPPLYEESTTAAAVTFRTLVPDLATPSDAERALLSVARPSQRHLAPQA
jgi:hypothetical protein